MVHEGFITPERADAARREPLQLASDGAAMRAPHFVSYVLDTLAAQVGTDSLLRGSLTITTTLDSEVQQAAQRILRRHIDQLAAGDVDHNVHNGAAVVLDPASGAILAMVGSPDYGNAAIQGQYNATLALRQPGSAIKPLTYAAALERGYTPASMLLDVPTRFETREGTPYEPRNYDQRYHGPLLLREALATSSNVAAVRVLDDMGLPALLDIAARLGITSLEGQRERFGLALALGGGEVRLLELSAAYAAFANGGQRVTPHALLAIEQQSTGATRTAEQPAPQEAISPPVAYLISDILSDRYARMQAFGAASVLDIDRPAAVKTGTTTDWRDNWTIGYTPDRVVGVWVGNADGSPMRNVSGITGAGPVWHDVMLAAHAGLPPRPFARPDGIVEQEICADSGLLPTPDCPATRMERFIAGTEPTRPDDTHIAVLVDLARNCRAHSDDTAPRGGFTRRVYRVLPPEAEAWAIDAGIPQVPPPCAPAASTVTLAQPVPAAKTRPALLEPAPGSSFVLTPGVPREAQRIELHAQAGGAAARLSIEIDGTTVASFEAPPYRAYWQPTPGTHRAVVVVQDRQGQQQRSAPVTFEVLEDTDD
jgi:membrane carboxypeptidase/penicillin-binding protein